MSDQENYQEQRDILFTEIRDLLNFNRKLKGPLAEELQAGLDQARERHGEDVISDEEYQEAADAMRSELIALRCAFIARTCENTPWFGIPPSHVLGNWASQAMKSEQESFIHRMLRNLFDPSEDDE